MAYGAISFRPRHAEPCERDRLLGPPRPPKRDRLGGHALRTVGHRGLASAGLGHRRYFRNIQVISKILQLEQTTFGRRGQLWPRSVVRHERGVLQTSLGARRRGQRLASTKSVPLRRR